jgi:hypothetical protein
MVRERIPANVLLFDTGKKIILPVDRIFRRMVSDTSEWLVIKDRQAAISSGAEIFFGQQHRLVQLQG